MHTFVVLGSHPELSLAEFHAATGALPSQHTETVAIFEDVREDGRQLMAKLGGIQKIGAIIGSIESWDHDVVASFLSADLIGESIEGKINFGMSIYDLGNRLQTEIARKAMTAAGLEIKNRLKESGRSARFVISKDPTLSAVVIETNHLLTKGAEYVLLVREHDILIGKTVAVQPFEDWSARDFRRPRRNAKQGMLPPKLARMMLNIAGNVENKTVLDPFCGSGTVLMEAAELGATHLIGSDIAEMAVRDTEANMIWLKERRADAATLELHTLPAKEIASKLPKGSVDMVVTETYLGRPRKGNETREDVQNTLHYVHNIYRESFFALKDALAPKAVVVLTAPIHEFEGEWLELPAIEIMRELGYAHEPLPFEPVVYRHKGQMVGRRILKFRLRK